MLSIFPSQAGMSLSKVALFPARESLVNHIPAGNGKIANQFLTVRHLFVTSLIAVSVWCRDKADYHHAEDGPVNLRFGKKLPKNAEAAVGRLQPRGFTNQITKLKQSPIRKFKLIN